MGDVEKRDIEVTGLTLFDISSVDDCLIASSPCGFNELELTGFLHFHLYHCINFLFSGGTFLLGSFC